MPRFDVVKETPIQRTPRVMQLEGLFDVSPLATSAERWTGEIDFPDDWQIGVIVGPSGSGKTTLAKELFGDYLIDGFEWDEDKSIVDCFPSDLSIKDITKVLSAVGFSSPPLWLRPYRVLSTGEKFRVMMARSLLLDQDTIAIDEFTSVIDRTVAQIGSAAVSRTVRKGSKKFVAVTCHYDVLDWLEPDWVYQPHTGEFYSGRGLHCRSQIKLDVRRVHRNAWELFRKYHYLATNIHKTTTCYCAFWNGKPVAFCGILHFPHPKIKRCKREHRLVCLPDYQGIGIGNALSDHIGEMLKSEGFRYQSSTGNPAMIASRNKSDLWKMIRKPSFSTVGRKARVRSTQASSGNKNSGSSKKNRNMPWFGVTQRYTASFEYIGIN